MTSSTHDHIDAGTWGEPHIEEVAEHVFAYIQPDGGWWINNTGFVLGERTVLCIDSCATERRTRGLLHAIDAVQRRLGRGAEPTARLLVSTHQHGDHTNGNCLMPDATIIGHPLCREAISRRDPSTRRLVGACGVGRARTGSPVRHLRAQARRVRRRRPRGVTALQHPGAHDQRRGGVVARATRACSPGTWCSTGERRSS